jgi:pyruvate,water dikinase
VHRSGQTAGAVSYREQMGLDLTARMAVVVQSLIDADAAGVLFTRNPVTGADERVIEAAWGLGEAVVQGRVVPDRYRLDRDGGLLERTSGRMPVVLLPAAGGEVAEQARPDGLAGVACLDDARLLALHHLALACDRIWDGDHDIEWAFADGAVVLLQRRPVTRAADTLSAGPAAVR